MKYTIRTTFLGITVTLLFFCFGEDVRAADITFRVVPNAEQNDAATIVEAYINPEGESLNAIEGIVGVLGDDTESVSSIIVETGGSAFSLWPLAPLYNEKERAIRFTGGSPQAFTDTGLLFRMRIFSEDTAQVTISWLGGSAYKADGEGTFAGISSRSLLVSLTSSEPNQISPASQDSSPPYFEEIQVTQDPDIYDGRYFLSFYANDAISGIARYEVVENQVTTEVNNGIYILHDQERKNKVIVIAYDKAGNSTSIKVPTKYEGVLKILVVVFGIVLILIFLLRKKFNVSRFARRRS